MQQSSHTQTAPDFHGAALIDDQGREVPITEAMVQRACKKLEQSWYYPAPESRESNSRKSNYRK